ncbi:homeodomain-like protein [Rhizophagus clarus]|nr:homeodomain-like protein [Rhizophagus clarus]
MSNNTNDDVKKEVTETEQTNTKKLSRMSIYFMLDNSCDEEYESMSSSSTEFGKEIDRRVYAGRKRRCRKNPYPMRAPSKDAPGINLKVDVYTPVMKDPAAILRSNDTSPATSPTDSVDSLQYSKNHMSSSSSSSSQFSNISLIESNNEPESVSDMKPNGNLKIKEKTSARKQRHHKEARVKRSGVIKPERKRKGNSLARVMTDRGLLESIFNTDITSTDIKSVRIPPPPPMRHDELIAVIKELNINHSILDNYTPDITWKGQPLNIAHLPHYNELHEIEAKVVSVLRLTPVQYLTGKHTLVSAARRYVQRNLPFKKSDAQKLLRIDVNKASKLWEFFRQVKWI